MKDILLEAKKLKQEALEKKEENLKPEDQKRILDSFSQILNT